MQLYLTAFDLLYICFFVSLGGATLMLFRLYKPAVPGSAGAAFSERWPAFFSIFTAVFLTIASAILLYAFIKNEFRLEYVASYSNNSLPLFYRITAFWAGRSGSMLFWAWSVAIGGGFFALLPTFKRLSTQTKLWHGVLFCAIMSFFLLLLIVWSNPFALLAMTPEDGRGLNPLLQNPGMIFHPPLLFLGYGGFVVPGCLALAQTLSGRLYDPEQGVRDEEQWEQASRPFILIAWALLTAGIILGAWWAYMELGWGGYWAWDPVENASLIPWLVASAYLHTAVIGSRRGKLQRTNVFLMALTTISAFFATYLVRSGVVESLHAFGSGDVGAPLIIFILGSLYITALIIFCSRADANTTGRYRAGTVLLQILVAVFFVIKAYSLIVGDAGGLISGALYVCLALALILPWFCRAVPGKSEPLEDITSKEGLLLMVAWLLLALSFIILVATMWPVIISTLNEFRAFLPDALAARLPEKPVGLDATFYNRTCLPLFALFAVLLVVCPFRKWKLPAAGSGFAHKPYVLGVLAAAVVVGVAFWFGGIRHPVALVAAACSCAGLIGIAALFTASPGQLKIRSTLAAHGVHIGLLLTVLGVAFSGPYQTSHTFQLGKEQHGQAGKYTVYLNEVYEGTSQLNAEGTPNFIFIEAELLVLDGKGSVIGQLTPQRRLYTGFDQQTYAEVSTVFSLGDEIYATMLGLDENNRATVVININPLVNWLWIGGTLMCLFPFAGLARIRRLRENGEAAEQAQNAGAAS